jgi:hypothetical protein
LDYDHLASVVWEEPPLLQRKRKYLEGEIAMDIASEHSSITEKSRMSIVRQPQDTGYRSPVTSLTTLEISADATDLWKKWFRSAFELIQQAACRDIAKEWIKSIHPKKQSTHPYNGHLQGQKKGCPERTKPPYWPRDVKHKEPDHIGKKGKK